MNIFTKLWNGAKKKSITFMSAPGSFSGMENFYDSLNLNTYKDSLYLFIGVSMIRETVSSIPLEMFRITNSDGDTEVVEQSEVMDLIGRPNYIQTQREFMSLSVAYYLLAGEAFWYFEKEGNQKFPTAMANMRPDHVEILLSETRKAIAAYKFTQSDGTTITILPENVLHVKNIDPTNPTRGVGVVRPATQRIITEKEASKYQAQTFKNQGRPDIAVFTDVDLDDEAAEDARERWNKIYGSEQRSAAGFFGNSIKDIKLLNVSPKEMDFINSQKFLRDDIISALRIPKAMLTSDDVNLANSRTARINYINEACLPVLDAFLDIVNNKWLADLDDDTFISYDSPANEEREAMVKEAVDLKNAGIITPNEARTLLNYPDMEGGDELSSAGNLFQLSMKTKARKIKAKTILRKRSVLTAKFKAIEATATLYHAEKAFEVERQRNSVFSTPELKEGYIKAFNEGIDKKARVFKDTIDVYNNGLLKRILKQIEDFGVNPTNIFNVPHELQEAKSIFTPLMKSLYAKAGQDTLNAVANGFDTKAAEEFYSADEIIRELERRSEFFVTSMLDTDFKEMKEIIAQSMKDGASVDQVGQALRLYFTDMSVSRAKTIARTETGRLVSQATNEAYEQSDVVTGKVWLSSQDGKVRDEHIANEAIGVIATTDSFPSGESYPGESSINCRCALAPAV